MREKKIGLFSEIEDFFKYLANIFFSMARNLLN